ncbi:MAG: nucleotidyl transferase AbiEii/AbiGii toxin family protein [Alphaproteobacteria bacterium]|nr:nucleotidyl transferase AbiEii/AbiGii toxin family protein [Alphaproteobacteria bacterium]
MSRHYCDLHCLLGSDAGKAALEDRDLGDDCVHHARMFFDRPDYDLVSAIAGSFAVAPRGTMVDALRRDYDATRAMIFGAAPAFDAILASADRIETRINATAARRPRSIGPATSHPMRS